MTRFLVFLSFSGLTSTIARPVHAKAEARGVIEAFERGATVARDEPHHHALDDRTISDLELKRVIAKLGAYAPSKMSRDRLTWWLTHPSLDRTEILSRQEAIREIADDDELFEHLAATFSAPGRTTLRAYFARLTNSPDLMGREALGKSLTSRTFGFEHAELLFMALNLYSFKELVQRAGTFAATPISSLWNLSLTSLGLASSPVMIRSHTSFVSGIHRAGQARRLEDEFLSQREFSSARLEELARLCAEQQSCARSVARVGRFHPSAGRGYVAARMSGLSPLLVLPTALYARRNAEAFLQMVDTVVEFETYYAAARMLRDRRDELVWPIILEGRSPRLEMEAADHPYLWASKKDVVANSIALDAARRGYVLTGPNTGGKTTFQQTKLLLSIMAMAGLPVPAERFEITPAIVMTDFKNDDANQNEEHSMFKAQTVRTSEVARAVIDPERTVPMIVGLDEILTGTSNTEHDALERGMLKTVLDAPDVLVTLATHERSLAEMSREFPTLGNLKVALEGHVIEPGVSTDYNALDVMDRAGAPARLLELGRMYLAREVAGHCDADLTE